MSKQKKQKEPKPRPEQNAEKLHINTSFEDALQVLSQHANMMVAGQCEEPAIQEPPTE